MNNERRRDWTVEALVTKAFLASTDEGQKSTREFRIQNDKLLRMLQKETRSTHQIAREILLGGPTKQEKKRRGKAHARIGEQRKKSTRTAYGVRERKLASPQRQADYAKTDAVCDESS